MASKTTDLSGVKKNDVYWMQDMDQYGNVCKQTMTNNNATYILIDHRESINKQYLVARLEDTHCWMLQNLSIFGDQTVSSTYTDTDSNYYLQPSDQSTANRWNNNINKNVENLYQGTYLPATENNTTTNTGGYYSWQVATAGDGSNYTTQYQNAKHSICPRGWKLPQWTANGNSDAYGEFYDLTNHQQYGNNYIYSNTDTDYFKYFKSSLNGRCYSSGCPGDSEGIVSYWSSTVWQGGAYGLFATSDNKLFWGRDERQFGNQIRCASR